MKVCTDSCVFGAWIANTIDQKKINPKTILDIGTGNGLLSLMLAQKINATIHAVEIDKNSFDQAKENFNASPWNKRLQPFHSDIKKWNAPHKYDWIISNPPFYENDLLPEAEGKNISKHNSALLLEELLFTVKDLLNEDGNFAVLLPWYRTNWFENAALSHSLFVKEKMEIKQTPVHNYFRTIFILQKQKTEIAESGLSIKNNNNEYTGEFIELMKGYYLYL
jgi:tRNA1Val (adenine37-N6)-methyltransferase